jgi:hypothetical protein
MSRLGEKLMTGVIAALLKKMETKYCLTAN